MNIILPSGRGFSNVQPTPLIKTGPTQILSQSCGISSHGTQETPPKTIGLFPQTTNNIANNNKNSKW
jgi:hypothetical protein